MHDVVLFSLTLKPPRQGAALFIPAPLLPVLGWIVAWAECNSQGRLREEGRVGGKGVRVLSPVKVSEATPNNCHWVISYCTPGNMPQTSIHSPVSPYHNLVK